MYILILLAKTNRKKTFTEKSLYDKLYIFESFKKMEDSEMI